MSQLNHSVRGIARSHKHDTRKVLAAALALALGTVGGGAHATTRLVTNCQDLGSGSMRAAITAAVSGDVVDATALTCSTISLGTGALEVTADSLTVKGPGPNRLKVQGYTKYSQVLRHEGTGTLALQGLTITDGVASPQGATPATKGGCIYSKGTVNLGDISNPTDAASGVVVSDCSAISTQAGISAQGGGIFAQNGVTLASSIVTRSTASAQGNANHAYGGGIYTRGGFFTMSYSDVSNCSAVGDLAISGGGINADVEQAKISHSTIAGNTASRVGGVYLRASSGLIQIDNTTVSGNSAAEFSGLGLVGAGSLAIRIDSSTITGNHTTVTGGGLNYAAGFFGGGARLRSTIIAGNFADHGDPIDLYLDTPATGSNNLLGMVTGTPPPNGLIFTTDPKLGPLTNHGGFTRVHLPLANSPAINAGNNSLGSMNDQRGPGFPRVIGSAPDIGAAEYDPDQIFKNGFD